MKTKLIYPILTLLVIGCQTLEKPNDSSAIISPPFEGIDVPMTQFTIDPTVENNLETERGTLIHIPANALIDKLGNAVTKPVELNYRPFHTTAEIIASGIPMQYDSLGQAFDFISAGMFELRANVDGEEVFIQDGKAIDVEFASYTNESGFNLYTFDDQSGSWDFIEPNIVAENVRKKEKIQQFKDAFLINLDLDYSTYPELKPFDQLNWMYCGDNPAEDPAKNPWIFEERWRSIDLKIHNREKAEYTMQLVSKNKTLDLVVSPYLMGKDTSFLAELDQGILSYNETVKSKKEDELALQIQADFIRSFTITNFGITNCDQINRIINSGEVFATNARFIIKNEPLTSPSKIYLLSGNEKSMLMREDVSWEKMIFKPNEKNSLMVVLPNNYVALCGKDEFERAKGKKDYDFVFSTYLKIEKLADLETLIQSI